MSARVRASIFSGPFSIESAEDDDEDVTTSSLTPTARGAVCPRRAFTARCGRDEGCDLTSATYAREFEMAGMFDVEREVASVRLRHLVEKATCERPARSFAAGGRQY